MKSRPDLGDRYRIEEPRGAGAASSVWRAKDKLLGRPVAIELFGVEKDLHLRRRELARLAGLRHPGLATIYDLDEDTQGRRVLIRELIEGDPLTMWRRDHDRASILEALALILGACDFLHRRGIVHRNIAPDNILVEAGGRACLVGFGLTTPPDPPERSPRLATLAPEVLAGGEATPAADLYAVGVLLHEALFGHVPFHERPAQKLTEEVTLPQSDADPALLTLCRALLSRSPAARPRSGGEALMALIGSRAISSHRVMTRLAGRGLPEPALLGRDALLAPIIAHLEARGSSRRQHSVVFVGPPASGKSRLLDELQRVARARGVPVLRGLSDTQTPLTPPTLSASSHQAPRTKLDALAERAKIVEGAVRSLLDRLHALLAQPAIDHALLLLDDVDAPLRKTILEVLSRQAVDGLVICATASPETAFGGDLLTVTLRPLAAQETGDLVASMMPALGPTPTLDRALHRASAGIPGHAAELLRLLADEHLTRGSHAHGPHAHDPSTLARAMEEDVDLSDQVSSLAARRVAQLKARQRRAAAFVGLFERGFPSTRLPEHDDLLALEIVDELLLQGVLALDEGHHLRLRSSSVTSLLGNLSLPQRVRLVDRALESLDEEDVIARAFVRVVSDTFADDAEIIVAGAREARRQGNLGLAARLYEAAATLPELPSRPLVLRELASLWQTLGQARAAVELLDEALTETGDEALTEAGNPTRDETRGGGGGGNRDTLLAHLADAHLQGGFIDAGIARLNAARRAHPLGARATVARAKLLVAAGRNDEALEVTEALPTTAADPSLRAEIAAICGQAAMHLGHDTEAKAALVAAREEARRAHDPLLVARASLTLGLLHQRAADLDAARASFETCAELARAKGHLPLEVSAHQNLASLLHQEGDLPGAHDAYRDALDLARRFGDTDMVAPIERAIAPIERAIAAHHDVSEEHLAVAAPTPRAEPNIEVTPTPRAEPNIEVTPTPRAGPNIERLLATLADQTARAQKSWERQVELERLNASLTQANAHLEETITSQRDELSALTQANAHLEETITSQRDEISTLTQANAHLEETITSLTRPQHDAPPEAHTPHLRPTPHPNLLEKETLKEALFATEEEIVRARLLTYRGNVTEAAKSLGMTRVGLHKLLKRHGIDASTLR